EVIHNLSEITKGRAILVTDVGQHKMTASRFLEFKGPLTNVTSAGAGTKGLALPAAFAAKVARAERDVVAVIGDSGYQMTVQELGTILQYKIPVKIIVLNNSYLRIVRQWQQLFHDKRYSCTDLVNPDFVKLAEAYDIPARRVTRREDLVNALAELIKADRSEERRE